MARAASTSRTIEFVGPPSQLRLVSDADIAPDAEFTPDARLRPYLEGVRRPLRVRVRGDRRARPLKLKLSPLAPPGTYEATLRSGGASHKVSVTVQRAPRVSITPTELHFAGPPGGEVADTMTFWNRGNVALALPDQIAVGLFDDDGLETAFASAYRQKVETFESIVEHFFGRLRDAHGGLLKLSVSANGEAIAPGAIRSVGFAGRLPSALKPSHAYHGVWSVDFANIALSVTVAGRDSP